MSSRGASARVAERGSSPPSGSTGTLFHALAAAVGVSALIASSATAFTVVKYGGAAYLIYLGVRKLIPREPPDETALPGASRRLFLEGVVIQALNPKVALFFLAFLPQFVEPSRGAVALQTLALGTLVHAASPGKRRRLRPSRRSGGPLAPRRAALAAVAFALERRRLRRARGDSGALGQPFYLTRHRRAALSVSRAT